MTLAKKEVWTQTVVNVILLVMILMLSIKVKMANAYVSCDGCNVLFNLVRNAMIYGFGSLNIDFCKSKCDSTGDRGCLKCKAGYVKEPTCCQCEGKATHR